MGDMIRAVLATLLIAATPCAALAQTVVPPPVPSIIPAPPPPAAPPPPRIEVPAVPKMDAPPAPVKSQPRRSFNDRAIDCLDDSYAARLLPGDRVAYSRSCANRAE
jgi:hypothetical protein